MQVHESKLVKARQCLKDERRCFSRYRKHAIIILSSALDTITCFRNTWNVEGLRPFESQLSQADRDCKIFLSRVNRLMEKLEACKNLLNKTTRCKTNKNARIDALVEEMLKWVEQRREFHKHFVEADDRLTKLTERIFEHDQ